MHLVERLTVALSSMVFLPVIGDAADVLMLKGQGRFSG
jgi:hypothetical protein